MKNKSLLAFISFSFLSACSLFAQAHISTQTHQSPVMDLAGLHTTMVEDTSVFSCGTDGFLVKWTDDGLGEHYQITDLQIKQIARSPNGNDVAVYESDGASLNRVTIWNWHNLSRKYSYRFGDPVTALTFSEKGSYLICGTASVSGTVFINANSGQIIQRKIKEDTGAVNMIHTSKTENSVIMYAPAGNITYYSLKNGSQKARFSAESNLSQVTMFNNEVFLAGVKNNAVYILQATTGQRVAQFSAQNPILVGSNIRKDLLYVVQEGRGFKIYSIMNDRNKAVAAPQLAGFYNGLKMNESIICAEIAGNMLYAGSSQGNVYKVELTENPMDAETIYPLTDNMYDYIYDVAVKEENFYFLTPHAIFLSSYDNGVVDKKGDNPGYTNLIPYGENIILWSKDTKKPVQLLDLSANALSVLFTPEQTVQSLRLYGDSLVSIEGNAIVNRYMIADKKKEQLYLGASLQDAILTSDTDLYVAKSSATNPAVPLLYVNCTTKETVPLSLRGNVAYALCYDAAANSNELYGILISTNSSKKTVTSLFKWNVRTKNGSTFLPITDEDSDSLTYLVYPALFTTMGKNQVHSYNLQNKRDFIYKRSASMPLKIAQNSTRLVILNRDGSISWYNPALSGVLADWYLTTDGQWFEF